MSTNASSVSARLVRVVETPVQALGDVSWKTSKDASESNATTASSFNSNSADEDTVKQNAATPALENDPDEK